MLKAYTHTRFGRRALAMIDKANEIIAEYQEEDLRLTLRQLYYQFVARDLIPNTSASYNNLGSIISKGRLAGYIDWSIIEDRTRYLRSNTHWIDPGHIIDVAERSFQLNHWALQQYQPEVWIEKEALIGVIEPICQKLDVSYFACKGYVSQSEMWEAAQRIVWRQDRGKETVIIHLGDHDPSGMDMTRDIKDRLRLFAEGYAPSVERIALNKDQVEQYNPPPNPAKITDTRAEKYIEEYGNQSWELDALEPRVLQELVSDTILSYRDDKIYKSVIRKEKRHRAILRKVKKNWRTL